jgi:TorA maturation chaperone TorD
MFSSVLPYETFNHNPHSLAKQYSGRDELLYEIISLYNSGNGDFIPNSGEAADHIGSELTFVAKIAGKEMKAFKSSNEIQVEHYARLRYSFLARHMLVWLPDFCKVVNIKASTAFYRTVTDLTVYIVKMDYDNLHARFRSEQTTEGCC